MVYQTIVYSDEEVKKTSQDNRPGRYSIKPAAIFFFEDGYWSLYAGHL